MEKAGFYFCACPDTELLGRFLDEGLARSAGFEGTAFEKRMFWGDKDLGSSFRNALDMQSLTPKDVMPVVRHAELLPAETWRKISGLLSRPREHVLPVFCLEMAWEKGEPKIPAVVAKLKCFEFASRRGWLWKRPGLDARSLGPYLRDRIAARGMTVDSRALAMLAGVLAPDAAAVESVLSQLGLFVKDGRITIGEVSQLSEFSTEAVIFDIIRDLEKGGSAVAWKAVLREGEGAEVLLFPLLTLMAREARMLWQLASGESVHLPRFVEDEKRSLAARVGKKGIARMFDALFTAENGVKSALRQPDQALEALVAELSLIFRPAGGAR